MIICRLKTSNAFFCGLAPRSGASVGFIIHKILYFCKDVRENPVGGRSTVEKHKVITEMRRLLETFTTNGAELSCALLRH
jgi:hypothetical protein